MDKRKVECPSCDWVGRVDQLVFGEYCPICNTHKDDLAITDETWVFNEDEEFTDVPYKIEDLVHDAREAENKYTNQFTPWQEDSLLLTEADIFEESTECSLSLRLLDLIAEDSRAQVDEMVNKIINGK